ncbi:endonuclease/exonuclease/phophatase family protein [Oleiphilus messinensis]|uniref:Endonuclease/exonuclease/phophatase family protein n=1 Tax=Oleiphilus messinensis TaxID=141451 RepID=A0A1Y0IFP6_9GAMM|nr:sphingomyelin phosphodiesterase [Oleiphilus messinensis]ARU58194.1 endonuclease/exonuclease/phophatase family protein [Oleiphilus messinensis]
MRLNQSLLLLLSFWTCFAYAESYVYVTNSTMETLTLDTRQTGHDNIVQGDQWDQLASTVPPLATVKFLRFNRDEGIKWGREYFFTTTATGAFSEFVMRQKLVGTMTFSKMWLSAENDPWHYDRDIHRIAQDFDGKPSELAFRSQYARVSGDDIHYVIGNNWQPVESAAQANHFKILSYNTWALLPGIEAKNTANRLDTIAEYVTGYDAVVFQEVFDPILAAIFRAKIQKEYPYITSVPFKFGKILTGGSFIASKWPIVEEDTEVYEACRADGCLASKGINYAKINKQGQMLNLFGTHTHAYTSQEDITIRFTQLAQLQTLIESKNIPESEPVILAGDFNVDKIHFPEEHFFFLELLNAEEPTAVGEYAHSYAGPVNVFADDQYTEYLDYVLYSKDHLQPLFATNGLLVPRSQTSQHWGTWDLSDHYPVAGEFVFPVQ